MPKGTEAASDRPNAVLDPVRGEQSNMSREPSSLSAIREAVRFSFWWPPLVAFLILAVAWDIYAKHNPYALPTIGAMLRSLTGNPGQYWHGFKVTIREIAIGGGSGMAIAFLLAVAMSEIRIIERALMPIMVTLMVMPVVAIAPALVIALGFGALPKYLVAGLVVLFPMLVNTLAGLRNVDGRVLDVFTTVNASRWETFRYLRLPGSLPFVFAGLRIAVPLSVVGAVVAELAAAGPAAGLGSLIAVASSASNVVVCWTSIFVLCALGLLLVAILTAIRGRVLWWDNESALARKR